MTVERYEHVVVLRIRVPANQPANSFLPVDMVFDPQLPAVQQQTVPSNEAWVIDDVYVTASQSIDAILVFMKGLKEEMARTSPINSLLVSNPSRPRMAPLLYNGTEILSINAINLQAGGTSDTILTAYMKLVRFVAR